MKTTELEVSAIYQGKTGAPRKLCAIGHSSRYGTTSDQVAYYNWTKDKHDKMTIRRFADWAIEKLEGEAL